VLTPTPAMNSTASVYYSLLAKIELLKKTIFAVTGSSKNLRIEYLEECYLMVINIIET
jgi:hypothetical protein